MLKSIIVDDDFRDREILEMMIAKYCPGVTVAGNAQTIDEAYQLILAVSPDLVFLDVELGTETGFDLLSRFTDYPFRVVFVTAYEKYALRAIKFSALDYILKPVDTGELIKAVQKSTSNINNPMTSQIKNLLANLAQPQYRPEQISVPTLNGFQLLSVEEIIYCEANKEYTYIHCSNQPSICSSCNLGEYEDLLNEHSFFRVHHSFIVNRRYIRQYIKGEGGELIMKNNSSVPVSRRRKQEVIEWLTGK